jgi:NADPH2:quinone reductase
MGSVRAVRVTELTGPDALRVEEISDPAGTGDVLITVKALGIGYSQYLKTVGKYQDRVQPPYTLDGEVAGVVLEVSPSSAFKPGDRVAAPSARGFAAEQVRLPSELMVLLPDGLSFSQGVCLQNFESTLFALAERGRLVAGETLLVHGGGSGTGYAAIQVARALGCRVFATVSSDDKERLALEAGAHRVLRSDQDWKEEALGLTNGDGVDAVFDPVGGDLMLDTIRVLNEGGRWIVYGFTGGIQQIPANRVMLRNVEVVGAYRTSYFHRHPDKLKAIDQRLMELLAEGTLRPTPGTTFAFEQAADALRSIASRQAVGQVVLELSS